MRRRAKAANDAAAAARAATLAAERAGETPDDAIARRTAVRSYQKEELAQKIAESKVRPLPLFSPLPFCPVSLLT